MSTHEDVRKDKIIYVGIPSIQFIIWLCKQFHPYIGKDCIKLIYQWISISTNLDSNLPSIHSVVFKQFAQRECGIYHSNISKDKWIRDNYCNFTCMNCCFRNTGSDIDYRISEVNYKTDTESYRRLIKRKIFEKHIYKCILHKRI